MSPFLRLVGPGSLPVFNSGGSSTQMTGTEAGPTKSAAPAGVTVDFTVCGVC